MHHHVAQVAVGEASALPHGREDLAHLREPAARRDHPLAVLAIERRALQHLQLEPDEGERAGQLVREPAGERAEVDDADLPGDLDAGAVLAAAEVVLQARPGDAEDGDGHEIRCRGRERQQIDEVQAREDRRDGDHQGGSVHADGLARGDREEDADAGEDEDVRAQVWAAHAAGREDAHLDGRADDGHRGERKPLRSLGAPRCPADGEKHGRSQQADHEQRKPRRGRDRAVEKGEGDQDRRGQQHRAADGRTLLGDQLRVVVREHDGESWKWRHALC